MRLHVFALFLCSSWPMLARADRVFLVGGTMVEGKVTFQGEKVIVELEAGELALRRSEVERIEEHRSPVQALEARLLKLEPGDIPGLVSLANFCRDHEMAGRERELLRKVLEVSPDHAEARARLGYVRSDKGWISADEARSAQGLVLYEGRWITRADLAEQKRREAELATARIERDKAALELEQKRVELARARATAADERRAAERAEREEKRRNDDFGYFGYVGYTGAACLGPAFTACGVTPLLPTPARHAATVPPPFGIPGVRDPRDMSFAIPGARDPRSYF